MLEKLFVLLVPKGTQEAWVEYVTFNSTLHMERQVALVWHRLHRLQVLFKRFGNIDKQHFNVSVVVRQHQVGSA